MSSHSSTPPHTEKHLQLWIYFLPLVGVVPAIWTLYRTKNSNAIDSQDNPLIDSPQLHQQLKASRRSINLTLMWLCSYMLLTYGAGSGTEIVSFRFLYANAITTTAYFVACTFLMTRLGRKKLFTTE